MRRPSRRELLPAWHALRRGEAVCFPDGDGPPLRVAPLRAEDRITPDDVVLAMVHQKVYLMPVRRLSKHKLRVQLKYPDGKVIGWAWRSHVVGILTP